MGDTNYAQTIDDYWGRDGLGQAILDNLAASGKNLDALTIDDLAPMDHFHGGGKGAPLRLARLAGLTPGLRVLDVGGGLGGPARTLAVEFGCHVTVVDLDSRVNQVNHSPNAVLIRWEQLKRLTGERRYLFR